MCTLAGKPTQLVQDQRVHVVDRVVAILDSRPPDRASDGKPTPAVSGEKEASRVAVVVVADVAACSQNTEPLILDW
jgi:hypothetical protein